MIQKNKKGLLTKTEQFLLNNLPDKTIVSLNSIRAIKVINKNSLSTILHRLAKNGFVIGLSRGRYYITKDKGYDRLQVGSNLVASGYIGLESALFIYGAIKSVPISTSVVTSLKTLKIKTIVNDKYILVPFGRLAIGYHLKNNYKISSKGKTLFDCIYKIRYVNYVDSIVDMANLMDEGDFSEFLYFSLKYGNAAMLERAGYMLELSDKFKRRFLKKIIKKLHEESGKGVVVKLKPNSPLNEKRYNKKWHIYDNIGLANATRRV